MRVCNNLQCDIFTTPTVDCFKSQLSTWVVISDLCVFAAGFASGSVPIIHPDPDPDRDRAWPGRHVPHGQTSPSPHRQPSHVGMSVMGSPLLLRTDSPVTWTCPSWAVISFSKQAAQSRGHVPHRQSSHSPHRQPSHVDMSLMDSPLILRTDSPVTWICPS